jgi:hypothetical protein
VPTIGLGTKGVGSVIERLKRGIRGQIVGAGSDPKGDEDNVKSKFPRELVIGLCGAPDYGTSIR